MTGWIIFGSILLVLILALVQSVTITAIYDKNPEVRIKILCFTIVKVPEDEKAKRKKAEKERRKAEKERRKAEKAAKKNGVTESRPAETAESTAETTAGTADTEESAPAEPDNNERKKAGHAGKPPKQKTKLPDISLDMIKDYIESASPPVRRLFKKIRIRDVYIDWVVGSSDAAVTALKYGGVCAALYPAFEWIDTYLDAKIKEINIEADFDAEKDDIFAYITLKLRISTALGCVIWLAFRVLKTYLKYNPAAEKKPKARPAGVKAR